MKDNNLDQRRRELAQKLEKNKEDEIPLTSDSLPQTNMGLAIRLVSDFVVFILVGAAVGYGIDVLLGTLPWGTSLFLLLGFVASIRNVIRVHERTMEQESIKKSGEKDDIH